MASPFHSWLGLPNSLTPLPSWPCTRTQLLLAAGCQAAGLSSAPCVGRSRAWCGWKDLSRTDPVAHCPTRCPCPQGWAGFTLRLVFPDAPLALPYSLGTPLDCGLYSARPCHFPFSPRPSALGFHPFHAGMGLTESSLRCIKARGLVHTHSTEPLGGTAWFSPSLSLPHLTCVCRSPASVLLHLDVVCSLRVHMWEAQSLVWRCEGQCGLVEGPWVTGVLLSEG